MKNYICFVLLAFLAGVAAPRVQAQQVAPELTVQTTANPTAAPEQDAAFAPAAVADVPLPSTGTVRDSVYVNPSQLPVFPGGEGGMADYLRKNIHYPALALQRHISGRVFVNFVLSAEGRVVDAHVMRGPGNGLDDEALRLVWLMPHWQPGRQQGQPVRVACTIPINFDSGK